MKFARIYVLAFAFLAVACSGGGDSSGGDGDLGDASFCLGLPLGEKIINGSQCSNSQSPIVRIDLLGRNGNSAICTGNVIASNKIVTAAHCFLFFPVESASVNLGDSSIAVTEINLHPGVGTDGTNLALFNDVAVISTRRSLGRPTIPIVVSQDIEQGDAIGVQGFGLDESGEFGSSRGGAMLVSAVSENHIFAAFEGEGSNPCNGDSGGPATFTLADGSVGIVGVVSSGNPETECFEGDVTLFTNLQTQSVLDFVLGLVPEAGLI